MEELIKWLKDINDNDVYTMGYKATHLAELTKEKYAIPRAFAISSKVYYSYLQQNNLKERIIEILRTIDYKNQNDIQFKSNEIRKLFFKNKETDDLRSDLEKMYNKVGETKVGWLNSKIDDFVAIRVSLTSEEVSQQHLDYLEKQCGFLNIKGFDTVILHIKECYFTMFSPEVLEYLRENKLDFTKIGMCVIIQKMVNAKISGIMITSKEVGEKNTIIEAVWGIGGSTIVKEITPDHYEMSKKNLDVVKKSKAIQEWQLKRVLGKTVKENIEKKEQDKQKLETAYLKELTSLAKKLETQFKCSFCVDWAFEKAEIFIIAADPLDSNLKKTKKPTNRTYVQEKIDAFKKDLVLEGVPVFSGVTNGYVKIIKDVKTDLKDINEKTIIVTKMTNGLMSDYIKEGCGIITDVGSAICHAALVAEKYSLPCVVNTRNATTVLKDGDYIQINGTTGAVYILTGLKATGGVNAAFKEIQEEKEISTIIGEIQEMEPEYPETITKIIFKLRKPTELSEVNFADVNGLLINFKSLFTSDEIYTMLTDQEQVIPNLSKKIRTLKMALPEKTVYYLLNLHQDNLVDENLSHLEIEALIEVNKEYKNLNVIIENMKSTDELNSVKDEAGFPTGIVINDLNKPNILKQYLEAGSDFIVFDVPEIDYFDKLRAVINMCKDSKIQRIFDIKNDYTEEVIKNLVELKINAVLVTKDQIKYKEIIYKKEKEILKNLLSI